VLSTSVIGLAFLPTALLFAVFTHQSLPLAVTLWLIDGVLDWMIGFINILYIHTVRDYRRYSAITILHTFRFTVPHALGFSAFTSRILATDLSQSHCNFNTHMKSSFLSLIISDCHLQNLTQFSRLLFYTPTTLHLLQLSRRTLLITTLHGPHRKHRLLLSRMRVYRSVT
jgi:hypothetical protein